MHCVYGPDASHTACHVHLSSRSGESAAPTPPHLPPKLTWMSTGSAPQSTIWFLLSSFLNARVRSAPADARCTLRSYASSRDTSGGMPSCSRTCVGCGGHEEEAHLSTQREAYPCAHTLRAGTPKHTWVAAFSRQRPSVNTCASRPHHILDFGIFVCEVGDCVCGTACSAAAAWLRLCHGRELVLLQQGHEAGQRVACGNTRLVLWLHREQAQDEAGLFLNLFVCSPAATESARGNVCSCVVLLAVVVACACLCGCLHGCCICDWTLNAEQMCVPFTM